MKKRPGSLGTALGALLLLAGCYGPTVMPQRQPIPTITQEGSQEFVWDREALAGGNLEVLYSMNEDTAKRLAEAFEEKTGCSVALVHMSAEEAAKTLTAGKPRADLYLGGTLDVHELLKVENRVARYESATHDTQNWKYSDHDRGWGAVAVEMLAIGVNTQAFAREFGEGAPLPATLEELAQPQYAGKVLIPNPETDNGGLTLYLSVLRSEGMEQGTILLEKLGKNVGGCGLTSLTCAQRTALGEFPLTICYLSDQLRMKAEGFAMESTVYTGAGWTVLPVSILADTGHLAQAQAFFDFVHTKSASELIAVQDHSLPTRSDVAQPYEISHDLKDYAISQSFRAYLELSRRDYARGLFEKVLLENQLVAQESYE